MLILISAQDFVPSPFCNDTTDNFKTINLNDYKSKLSNNPQDYTFEFKNESGHLYTGGNADIRIGLNIFDVKITSSLGCYQDLKLSLTLNAKPKIDLDPEVEFR